MHDPNIATIRINGGRLCLDFVNTATWEDGRTDLDFLTDYAGLLTWGARQGLLAGKASTPAKSQVQSAEAAAALARGKELRHAFRQMFEPGSRLPSLEAACGALNQQLSRLGGPLRIEANGGSPRLAPAHGIDGWLVSPLLVSALDLAASPERAKVNACAGDGCHWLFLDLSRNGTRRWCSMESCGNRAKARAHYLSHRGSVRA